MQDILITNNSLVKDKFGHVCKIIFTNDGLIEVLVTARDYIHNGHELLSHPLSGSVKPNENPYKSVLVSAKKGSVSVDSLRIIENAITSAQKFLPKYPFLTPQMHSDFAIIDLSLISSALA